MPMTAQQKKEEIEELFEKTRKGILKPELEDGDELYPFPQDGGYEEVIQDHLSDSCGVPCYEWLGFDVTSDQHLTMEFNIVDSAVRFQLKFSMRRGDRRCFINLRPRANTHDGHVTNRNKALFVQEIINGFGPNPDFKNITDRIYFKPFGQVPANGKAQKDVLFDAIFVGVCTAVHACPARPLGSRDSLRSAIHHVLDILKLCLCNQGNTANGMSPEEILEHRNAWGAYELAKARGERWPAAEEFILENIAIANRYALHVIKADWPELNQKIESIEKPTKN